MNHKINSKILSLMVAFVCVLSFNSCKDEEPDAMPFISIDSPSEMEGNSDSKTISFTIKAAEEVKNAITFEYQTIDGSAIAGEDYEETSGSGRIDVGQTQTTIEVTITGDEEVEGNEDFLLELTNVVNGLIALNKGTGTILNDDEDQQGDIGYSTPLEYPDYTLVWNDEFDGDALNQADWNFETGNNGWGNNELQNYMSGSSNTSLSNGQLTIEARQQSVGGSNYTSARITTQGKQFFKYGRVDIRAKLPQGQGIWPALWMLGENFSDVGWPSCGEIDIMELVGHEADVVHGTAHWDNSGSFASYGQSTSLTSGIFADEFHVFSIIWDENTIRWYMDDNLYNTISITPAGLSEFQEPFFFIFNIAVGGNWPGSPNASTSFPQTMVVDYVRVFQ